jgi:hypothetical protein
MRDTVKKKILGFLKKNPVSEFNKTSEPSAIAYETYIKSNQLTSFSYFNRVFNEVSMSYRKN